MNRPALLLYCLLCAAPAGLAAGSADTGTGSAAFLKLPPDPAAAATGEACAARSGGALALFLNPAALAGNKAPALGFSQAALMEGLAFGAAAAAVPLGPGVLAAGAEYLSYGGLRRVDNTGAERGSLSPRDSAAALGWAMPLGGGLYAGAAAKGVSSKIYGSASAQALDLGLLLSGDELAVGLAVQNLGRGLKFREESSPLPVNTRLGVRLPYGGRWAWLADLNFPKDGAAWLAAGGEYAFAAGAGSGWRLACRAGYNTAAADTGGLNGFTAGFGLARGGLELDYALRTLGLMGLTHHFGAGYRWGAPKPAPAKAAPRQAAAKPPPGPRPAAKKRK